MKKRKTGFYLALLLIAACVLLVPAFAADGGKHWWDAFSWFGEIANFVKSLVVPPANYWHNRLALLNSMVNAKFAGLGQLYRTLDDFFRRLSDPAAGQIIASIPDDFLFRGYRGFSMNFFGAAAPYIRFLRAVLSGACFLFTAIVCYHKVRTFFTEET
mgnify:CR=1 FL=1|jgi:hypothetical protein